MEPILGTTPLTDENQLHFQKIWNWFVVKRLTTKDRPQVASDRDNYHVDGLIGINEGHHDEAFPLAAVMLEEILHYILTSDDPAASADFSPTFLQGILRIITAQLDDQPVGAKRQFQSMLIRSLWDLIDKDRT